MTTATNVTTASATSTASVRTDRASASATTSEPSPILRRVFWFDRAIAFTSGVALIALSSVFGTVLDWPTAVVAALGAALLPYGAFLHWIVANRHHARVAGKLTLGTDVAWVAASVVVFVSLSDDASSLAPWLVAGQALVITDVAIAKAIGFMRDRG